MEPVFADTLSLIKGFPTESQRYRGLLLNFLPKVDKHATTVTVKNVDCLDEFMERKKAHPDATIGVLNMASDRKAGGGVISGAMAQEEDLCRRTSLYPTLVQHRYPLNQEDMVYSPDVFVVKNVKHERLSKPVKIDGVLSIAAVRNPPVQGDRYFRYIDRDVMRKKIRLLLQTAAYHKLDCLVLGALGCGCFGNPSDEVAHLFKEAMSGEFKGVFKHVSFAIREFPPYARNLAFRRAFGF